VTTSATSGRVHYFDTSALVKLVVAEAESAALIAWLSALDRHPVVSDLARTELVRAVSRAAPERLERVRYVLASVALVQVTPAILQEAGRLRPETLRSLDGIHLATALVLDDELESFVTYDERLADAARFHGLPVTTPR
jgi:predicted nucleic acid-binding protein